MYFLVYRKYGHLKSPLRSEVSNVKHEWLGARHPLKHRDAAFSSSGCVFASFPLLEFYSVTCFYTLKFFIDRSHISLTEVYKNCTSKHFWSQGSVNSAQETLSLKHRYETDDRSVRVPSLVALHDRHPTSADSWQDPPPAERSPAHSAVSRRGL